MRGGGGSAAGALAQASSEPETRAGGEGDAPTGCAGRPRPGAARELGFSESELCAARDLLEVRWLCHRMPHSSSSSPRCSGSARAPGRSAEMPAAAARESPGPDRGPGGGGGAAVLSVGLGELRLVFSPLRPNSLARPPPLAVLDQTLGRVFTGSSCGRPDPTAQGCVLLLVCIFSFLWSDDITGILGILGGCHVWEELRLPNFIFML